MALSSHMVTIFYLFPVFIGNYLLVQMQNQHYYHQRSDGVKIFNTFE